MIDLYALTSPNVQKIYIMLEETKLSYKEHFVDVWKSDQFDPEFLKINPNGKIPARAVLPAAVVMGLLSEVLKYAYILALPWLNFQDVYGPFALSVSLMFWAFLSGLLLLAGANLSAEEHLQRAL